MDEFVAMLERAAAPLPDGLVDRVLEAATATRAALGTTSDGRPPALVSLGEPSEQPERRSHRVWLIGAIAVAAAVVVVALLVAHRREHSQPTSSVAVIDPGRLPTRVTLGSTDFVLTWLPPGFHITATTDTSVTASADGWPDIVVSAKAGESSIGEPFVDLGPLAQAHFDDPAGLLRWNVSGWTLTIDAASPVRSTLLGRMAVGIVRTDALVTPPADPNVSATVANVIGLDYRDAQAQLEAAGFNVRLGISSTGGTTVGAVESMTPAPGAIVKRGATVALGVTGVAGRALDGWSLVSGDLSEAVGYMPFARQPLGDGFYGTNEPDPIVFLHGELVGYGVGPSFEPLRRAAAAVGPGPEAPLATTGVVDTAATPSTSDPMTTAVTPDSEAPTMSLLAGHEWLVRAQGPTASGSSPWPDGAAFPWVELDATGAVSGFDGCTAYTGTATLSGLELVAQLETAEPCEGVIGYGRLHGGRVAVEADGTASIAGGPAGLPDLVLVRVDSLPVAENLDGIFATDSTGLSVDFVADTHTVFFGSCTATWTLVDGTLTAHPLDLRSDCIDLNALNAADLGLFDLLTSSTPAIVRSDQSRQSVILMNGTAALRLYQLTQPGSANSFSLTEGSVLGVRIGQPMSPDDLVAAAEPTLGSIGYDSGWYMDTAPRRGDGTDCLAGFEYRVLWWGDLSIAFRRIGGESSIWAWSVGDRRASGWGDRRESYAPTNPVPSNLPTAGGLQVGSTVDGLHVQFGDSLVSDADLARTYGDGTFLYNSTALEPLRWGYVQHRNIVSNVTVVDGVVTGFGAAGDVC